MTRQVGLFKVADLFFYRLGPDEGCSLFHRMVVLRAEQDIVRGCINYVAIHPDFRHVKPGEMIPEYTATFTRGEIYPKWTEVKK